MSGWTTKKLGEVCTFRRGLTYSKGDEVEHSSKVVLRANNISLEKNQLCFDELKFIRDDFEIPDDKYLEKDCVLICTASGSKAHLGKVAYIDKEYDFAFGGFMGLIVPDVSLVFSRYFYYVLTAENYRQFIQRLTDGANINNLKFSQLAEFDIPIPPLAEQKRIVAKIDAAFEKIDRLKANAEKNLANAKELFQSALDEAMRPKRGWVEKRLGEIGEYRKGPFGSALTKRIFVLKGENTIKVYEQKNAIRKSATIGEYYITREYFNNRMTGFEVLPGDVIVSCAGTIGETFIMPENMERGIINQALMRMRISSLVDKGYFLYYFDHVLKKSANALSNGSAMKNIPPFSVFKQLLIPLPPIEEQKRIVLKLDDLSQKLETLQQNYAQQIADCAEMRQAILREAFEGRL